MSEAIRVAKVSALFNFTFSAIKGVAGVAVGSVALIADALHSLVDVLGSIFVWFGLKIAERPADVEHPYGYYKAESLAELGVGLIIIFSTVLIIKEAVEALISQNYPSFEYYAAVVAATSAAGNEVLARYKIAAGRRTKSSALIAEGKHSRADVFGSLAVLIGFIFIKFGYWWADSIVAILISFLIIQMGIGVVKSSIDVLMDRVDEDFASRVREILEGINGIASIDLVAARGTWRNKIVEVHYSVFPWATELIDTIQEDIEKRLRAFPEVSKVVPVVRIARKKPVVAIPVVDKDSDECGDLNSPYFAIFSNGEPRFVENPYSRAERRKGPLIAELLAKEGVNVLVIRRIGEMAAVHMRAKGIAVFTGCNRISDAL
ncbi:MAG: cation diffusion facilitator family transporter, partial [Archaeoglobales archaeon]